jgi:hypothetical protein
MSQSNDTRLQCDVRLSRDTPNSRPLRTLHEIAHFLRTELDFFAIFSSTFSSYFVCREKATNSLSPPMTMSFFIGQFVKKILFLLAVEIDWISKVQVDSRQTIALCTKIMKING